MTKHFFTHWRQLSRSSRKNLLMRFLPFFLSLTSGTFIVLLVFGRNHLEQFYYQEKFASLEKNALLTRLLVGPGLLEKWKNDPRSLQQQVQDLSQLLGERISVIFPHGKVIADSEKSPDELDNHQNRPEIRSAISGKVGGQLRHSASTQQTSLYLALPIITNGKVQGVIRHALPHSSLVGNLHQYIIKIFWFSLGLGLLLTSLLVVNAIKIRRPLRQMFQMTRKIAAGDFHQQIVLVDSWPFELQELASGLNQMATRLHQQLEKIIRQRNEREAIFASMTEGVLSVYLDGTIFHWNQSVCDLFGVANTPGFKGKSVQEIFHNPQLMELIEKIKQNGGQFLEEEMDLAGRKILQIHGTFLSRPQNRGHFAVLMVFNDITRLRELERHRKEFVANVGHELRTPLTSIQGYLETIIDGGVDDAVTRDKFLRTIQKNTQRLHRIIEELLLLSEIERGQQATNFYMVREEISHLLQNVIEIAQIKARKKHMILQEKFLEPLYCQVNPVLFEQAILNLLENAIKYSFEQTPITIFTQRQNHRAVIGIQDFGPGIAPAHLGRIFERFYSVSKSKSRALGGTGLGLSLVKHIAFLHEGEVTVESVEGQGSIFRFILPIDDGDQLVMAEDKVKLEGYHECL